ncbi:MAG TPA: hypothetical protein VG722_11355, partial [Tepidisphaeraceae bacterium]|nr:hypothetical protein [Tepidisphaeraceae bacterium]
MKIIQRIMVACGLGLSLLCTSSLRANSIIGYSGDKSENAYVGTDQVSMTAGQARAEFLGSLSGYYYEDFQEAAGNAGKNFTKLGLAASGYQLQWKSPTLDLSNAPNGTLTTGSANHTIFRLGPDANARGAFDTY